MQRTYAGNCVQNKSDVFESVSAGGNSGSGDNFGFYVCPLNDAVSICDAQGHHKCGFNGSKSISGSNVNSRVSIICS